MGTEQQHLHNASADQDDGAQADAVADLKLQLLQAQCVLDAKDRELAGLRSLLSVSHRILFKLRHSMHTEVMQGCYVLMSVQMLELQLQCVSGAFLS